VANGEYAGMKVTVMGLGLNGGGLESARYLALHGAECTVTDMKDEKALFPSIEKLESLSEPHPPFHYVLGRHEIEDFSGADMVIKNPGVRPDSPYLAAANRIETDISLFLAASPARLTAVTGSKGKSGTASAVHWVLSKAALHNDKTILAGKAFLGGNITISPLSFLDELNEADDVVLELSSWQLGDLKNRICPAAWKDRDGSQPLLKPRAAILSAIMADHMDRYGSMEAYVNDKRIVYQGQNGKDVTIASADDSWGRSFLSESPGRTLPYSSQPFSPDGAVTGRIGGGWIDPQSGAGMVSIEGNPVEAVPSQLLVPGRHQKKNFLAAALALLDLGIPIETVRQGLASFPGIEHRLEFFREIDGIRFYNDTSATIPEAAAAAIEAFAGDEKQQTLVLVVGGNDKNLDFSPLVRSAAARKDPLRIILLAGTGSDKLGPLLKEAGLSFHGPFDNMDTAARIALESALAMPHVKRTVILSPGCTSFGLFKNEFDRGRQWKEAVCRL